MIIFKVNLEAKLLKFNNLTYYYFSYSAVEDWVLDHIVATIRQGNCHHQVSGTPDEKTATAGLRRAVGDHHPVGVLLV